ncbi:MAG: hypothetical protein EHM14_08440 [Methanothrix sp.]|nr:MAG: hypothetical protein EHM14_08440 [Methanothrix sp.]
MKELTAIGKLDKQGRVVVPLPIRDILGLNPGDYIEFVVKNKHEKN